MEFKEDFKKIKDGSYNEWELNHDGRLALIILCDQIPRIVFRYEKEAYAYDEIALKIAKKIVSNKNHYNKYKLMERVFIVFPFMHSENVVDCQKSLELFKELIEYAEEKEYESLSKPLNGLYKSA